MRRSVLALCSGVVLALPLFAGVADADPAPPTVTLSASGVYRSSSTFVHGTGFAADTEFDLASAHGTFRPVGSVDPTTSVTTDSKGAFYVRFFPDPDLPLSTSSVDVVVTAPDGSTTTDTIAVLPPAFDHDVQLCPTDNVSFDVRGLPGGTYTVSSPAISFSPTTVTASAGQVTLGATASGSLPASTTVTLTSGDNTTTLTVTRRDAYVQDALNGDTLWRTRYRATCFAPGEVISVRYDRSRVAGPSAVRADALGTARFDVTFVAAAAPSTPAGVTLQGTASGQQTTSEPRAIQGTSLFADSAPEHHPLLISPHRGYSFSANHCNGSLYYNNEDGSGAPVWFLRGVDTEADNCRFVLGKDGNVVLFDGYDRPLWATHTSGTGAHNRLIMRDDGALVEYTNANVPVWSSRTGIIRTPSAMGAGQSLTTGQVLANGAARLVLLKNGNVAVFRNGVARWQTRTTGSGAVRLTLTTNGDLRLYTRTGRVVWSSGSACGGNHPTLAVDSTGNVRVITYEYPETCWSTRSG